MRVIRIISEREGLALKAATRRAVEMAGGSDSFSLVTRVGQGQLSKYGLTTEEHAASFMPIDIALEADKEAGAPVIVERMAALLGYRLVKADGEAPRDGLALADVARLSARVGTLCETTADALADGHVSPGEERDIQREIFKIKAQIAKIEAKTGGGA